MTDVALNESNELLVCPSALIRRLRCLRREGSYIGPVRASDLSIRLMVDSVYAIDGELPAMNSKDRTAVPLKYTPPVYAIRLLPELITNEILVKLDPRDLFSYLRVNRTTRLLSTSAVFLRSYLQLGDEPSYDAHNVLQEILIRAAYAKNVTLLRVVLATKEQSIDYYTLARLYQAYTAHAINRGRETVLSLLKRFPVKRAPRKPIIECGSITAWAIRCAKLHFDAVLSLAQSNDPSLNQRILSEVDSCYNHLQGMAGYNHFAHLFYHLMPPDLMILVAVMLSGRSNNYRVAVASRAAQQADVETLRQLLPDDNSDAELIRTILRNASLETVEALGLKDFIERTTFSLLERPIRDKRVWHEVWRLTICRNDDARWRLLCIAFHSLEPAELLKYAPTLTSREKKLIIDRAYNEGKTSWADRFKLLVS